MLLQIMDTLVNHITKGGNVDVMPLLLYPVVTTHVHISNLLNFAVIHRQQQ